jgi:hypothetical protein
MTLQCTAAGRGGTSFGESHEGALDLVPVTMLTYFIAGFSVAQAFTPG